MTTVPKKPGREVEDGVYDQPGCQAYPQNVLQGNLRVPVRPAAQQRLGNDAGQTADGGEGASVAAGEATVQQQSRLVAGKRGESGPVEHLHQGEENIHFPQGRE